MKIKQNILDKLNEQICIEFGSAMLYLAMSSDMHNAGLDGVGHWLRVQYQEELEHGLKIFDYILQRDEHASVLTLDQPSYKWNEPADLFLLALEHEQMVTRKINELVLIAKAEEDYATDIFLHWYVTEQVEEEHQVQDILDKLRAANDCGSGLLYVDAELAKRRFRSILDQEE